MKILTLLKNSVRSVKLSFAFAALPTFFLILTTVVASTLPVWQSKVMGDLVNQIVEILGTSEEFQYTVASLVGLYALLWAITKMTSAARLYADKVWTSYTQSGLEIMIMKKRTEIDLGHYENPDFQNLLHRAFNRSIWPVFELIELWITSFGNLAVFITTSLFATQLSPLVYIIVVVTCIPTFVVQLRYGSKMWSIWSENSPRQRRYSHIRTHVNSRTGVTQTKLLQASERLVDMAREIDTAFRNDQLKTDRANLFWSIVASIIAAVGMGASFFIVAESVTTGAITIGSMVFLVAILGQLVGSINSLLADLARQFDRNLYVDDIFKVMDTKPYVIRSLHPQKLHLSGAPRIEFKDVWFKYEGREDWILRGVNLVIEPGERVAVVGENGAGKSTFVKLVSRIYDPTKGNILINGIDLKEIDTDEWSSYLAVLLQDYMTYDFTVSESIAMGRADKELEQRKVEESAEYTGAHDFISSWKEGFSQQLGKEFDGGIEPSKGQRQKLALAQTIYREGRVVILDEPTAAIDAVAETYIFEQMEKAVKGNTLIVITHRFNTTQSVDKIVVMEKGEVVEVGPHTKLLQLGGFYAEMFEAQAKGFRDAELAEEDEQ